MPETPNATTPANRWDGFHEEELVSLYRALGVAEQESQTDAETESLSAELRRELVRRGRIDDRW